MTDRDANRPGPARRLLAATVDDNAPLHRRAGARLLTAGVTVGAVAGAIAAGDAGAAMAAAHTAQISHMAPEMISAAAGAGGAAVVGGVAVAESWFKGNRGDPAVPPERRPVLRSFFRRISAAATVVAPAATALAVLSAEHAIPGLGAGAVTPLADVAAASLTAAVGTGTIARLIGRGAPRPAAGEGLE
jgi:hypothetical protein